MDRPIDRTQQLGTGEPNQRAKPSKACVPCRARKVKCDAPVIGLPCSSCTSRQCPDSCILTARKRRKRTVRTLPTPGEPSASTADVSLETRASDTTEDTHSSRPRGSIQASTEAYSHRSSPDPVDGKGPRQSQSDLHYLNILQDAVNDSTPSQHPDASSAEPFSARPEDSLTPRIRHWNKPPQLDDIDNEYLTKKGVFELPPQRFADALLKIYFESVYPFSPVVDKTEFIRSYRAGNCSMFLLHTVMATAVLYAPIDIISGCGFQGRVAAQASFVSKAALLHDFHCENNSLALLQGSLNLGVIILDNPTDRDFQYWFHNSIRLAVKLDLFNTCTRDDKSFKSLKLYRRIWWVLYARDNFLSFVNPQNFRLLENMPLIKPMTENDWEQEEVLEGFESLPPTSHRQKACLVAHCEMDQIFAKCSSNPASEQQQDPRSLMRALDEWRMSLAEKMDLRGTAYGGDIYYPEALATSYRLEAIMCRLLRYGRWQRRDRSWSKWAKERLRSAILELNTIAERVLSNGTIHRFPTSFLTTLLVLLALHIESALDPSESDLVRSMSRIAISQTMLVLRQVQEVPAIKRALPIFEMVLSKKNLSGSLSSTEHSFPQTPSDWDITMHTSPQTQTSIISSQAVSGEYPSFYGDFLGFDFLDRWQIEQLDFTGIS